MDEVAELAVILLHEWDPLQVRDLDTHPESEYLHEAAQVLELLKCGAQVEAIAELLATAQLGPPDARRDQTAAASLAEWWKAEQPRTP